MLVWISALSAMASAASQPHYVVTNDDVPFANSVTFYTVDANGLLALKGKVSTGGWGIGGGYFAANRIAALDNATDQCVYASDASTGDVAGIDANTLIVAGRTSGSASDSGGANGIALAANSQYLYAGFSSSNTIGTFQVQAGCTLSFVNDISVAGLQGGFIGAMAIHGNIMVVTYGDGSVESFNISSGTPIPNGDEQNSTGYLRSQGANYPNDIKITKDGRFALFGDTSTSTVIEVSDIGSGKLSKTAAFSLGAAINSSNILLSPDETLLYISNTQGDTVTAASFDASTGKISAGCTSGKLKGYSVSWSYLAGLALATNYGTGNTIYVAEFGATSSIGVIQVGSSGGKCTLTEGTGSPVKDPNSPGLLSIGAFPPRSF
jgi:sugar lactone lactonase YvrE